MLDHVLRRGLQHAAASGIVQRGVENARHPELAVPWWGIALVGFTFLASIIFTSLVEYTLKDLLAALIMVETPSAAITVTAASEPAPASKDDKEGLLESGPAIALVHGKPVISSIRGGIRHLVSQGGRWARFRGCGLYLIYGITFAVVSNILMGVVPRFPGHFAVVAGMTGAALANLHAAWTHWVISAPSDGGFLSRIPSRRQWKTLALPAALEAAMPYVAAYVAMAAVHMLGLGHLDREDVRDFNGGQWASLVIRVFAVALASLLTMAAISIPAVVVLVRVEASILPEDQDTIVPFDRTFGGKVVPRHLGGSGSIGMLDAWRSFTGDARRRLLKHYVKTIFVLAALGVLVAHVLAFEILAVAGAFVTQMMAQGQRQA